jgi:hypothetical protein
MGYANINSVLCRQLTKRAYLFKYKFQNMLNEFVSNFLFAAYTKGCCETLIILLISA